jgi:hypothetical protein
VNKIKAGTKAFAHLGQHNFNGEQLYGPQKEVRRSQILISFYNCIKSHDHDTAKPTVPFVRHLS